MPARHSRYGLAALACATLAAGLTAVGAPATAADFTLDRTVATTAVNELSGLARSTRGGSWVFTANDKGDANRVYVINANGSTKSTLTLKGATNVDWEDLAAGPGNRIWVADSGDDTLSRSTVQAYAFVEPTSWAATKTLTATKYSFSFPDGRKNAEGLLVHPSTGRLYFVSRASSGAAVYAAPSSLSTKRVNTLTKVADAPAGVTAAAFTPDGTRLVLGTSTALHAYPSLGGTPVTVALPSGMTSEAVEVTADGKSVLVGQLGSGAPIYRTAFPEPAPVNSAPTAAFTTSVQDLTATFDGTGSTDPDGTIASYAWNFGDGTTGTGSKPTKTYAAAGSYTVTLTVTDDKGATHTATRSVTATKPNAAPTASFGSTADGLTVAFDGTGSTDPDGTVAAYAWNFGDGSTGTGATPSHDYTAEGTYPVTLTVTDDKGATDTTNGTVTVTAPPALVTDTAFTLTPGSSAKTKVAPETYTDGTAGVSFTVPSVSSLGSGLRLATSVRGTSAEDGYRAVVNFRSDGTRVASIARVVAGASTTLGTMTLPGTFQARTSHRVEIVATGTGSSVALKMRSWKLGDTVPDWQLSAADTSAERITSNGSPYAWTYLSGSATETLSVPYGDAAAASVNATPTASYTRSVSGLTVAFDGTGSSDPDGTVSSYAWNYGDGTTGTGSKPTKTYAAAGTYTVTLTVTDDKGATDTVTGTVNVSTPNAAPTASFTSSASGLTVAFDGTGSTDPDGTVSSYAWNYGDGTTGTGSKPTKTYAAAGTYTVTLTVTDDKGATHTATRSVTVSAPAPGEYVLRNATFDAMSSGSIVASEFQAQLGGTYGQGNAAYSNMSVVADDRGAGKVLRVKMLANMVGSNGGANIFAPLPRKVEEACVSYDIRFGSTFDWSLGGKLPGLSGVKPGISISYPTGGKADYDGTQGWSGRMMWLTPKSYSWAGPTNMAVSYMYHPGQSTIYGDNVRFNKSFTAGKWHNVKQCYRMNTPGVSDGGLQGWFDGVKVVDLQNYVYRLADDVAVGDLMFAVFRGGDSAWSSPTESYIDFDNMRITTPQPAS